MDRWTDGWMDGWMDGITDVVSICWFEFDPAEATPLVVVAVIDGVVSDGDAALAGWIPADDGATVGVLHHRYVLRRNRRRSCSFSFTHTHTHISKLNSHSSSSFFN